ncbi:DUF2169 family type VI secretion system accessory protein [Paraburkholderia susongensis]|uniref:Uncharacterized protein YjbI, contains pentapeptide repeats n=1 Tax=Paraburkholderia susongensis TaxID=1515439 RepID=A0A1X7M6X7_9BURK|nr:pentapeptide repeat-containing protein [Paraburkholderia susongensis]SMG61139.1 Uncharacterized protein YjbI, contains pentapeptide repeats [Paraburkholderia susongensis]
MKTVMPQQGFHRVAYTQFGTQAWLGLSLGLGFRLSDPQVLMHSLTCGDAIARAPTSVMLAETGYPKEFAEWLVAGHSRTTACGNIVGATVDWTAQVQLGKTLKTVSCSAKTIREGSRLVAQLPVDHSCALKNEHNLIGQAVPPLRKLTAVGPVTSSRAGMGPIEMNWQDRRQWIPLRRAQLDPFGADGTHMGWPDHTNLKLFQTAWSDQWSNSNQWPAGTRYELAGFGPEGIGYVGHTPNLVAQVAIRRGKQAPFEWLPVSLQTVWLLPDVDIGVLWWHGMASINGIFSEEIETIFVAFKEPDDVLDTSTLETLAARSCVPEQDTSGLRRDSDLLPDAARGWVWELILDHAHLPRNGAEKPSRKELAERMREFEQSLDEMESDLEEMRNLQQAVSSEDWQQLGLKPVAQVSGNWQQRLRDACKSGGLADCNIEDMDFSSLSLTGLNLKAVRFKRCSFQATLFDTAMFDDVVFIDCDMSNSAFRNTKLVKSSLERCCLDQFAISQSEIVQTQFTECRGERIDIRESDLANITLDQIEFGQPVLRQSKLVHSQFLKSKLRKINIEDCVLEGIATVDSDLSQAEITNSQVLKCGFTSSILAESSWTSCNGRSIVISQESDTSRLKMRECHFKHISFSQCVATGLSVENSTFIKLSTRFFSAAASRWENCDLTSANFINAVMPRANFRRTSLKDALFLGADLRDTQFDDCNMLFAQTGWADRTEVIPRNRNLLAGACETPIRKTV